MTHLYSLPQLGWQPFFQSQLTLDEWQQFTIARVITHQRSSITLMSTSGTHSLQLTPAMPAMTVGDWVLLDQAGHFHRALERLSLFSRKAAGSKVSTQLIAANIDTVFIVSSLNQDFNLNRIERYLAMAREAGVVPVVVLSKLDCCDNPDEFCRQVQAIDPLLAVVSVNGLSPESVSQLKPWCGTGNTVALLGSSGVGKSTLINTLAGSTLQHTQPIREDDAKGRHTTTGRFLHLLPAGGLLLDTPGMRELQLADCEHGIEQTFSEISELAMQCRFSDCRHEDEPGCAVRAAIDAGTLEPRRLSSYLKLMREQALNKSTLAEKRARDRNLGRFYRSVLAEKRQRKKPSD
jgi:ribosome biogenesis GTPase